MKTLLLVALALMNLPALAQYAGTTSPLDGRNLGIVLEHPDMKKVVVQSDVAYLSDAKGTLKLDIYQPPRLQTNEKRPVIVFLNALGEFDSQRKLKSWGVYQTWPKLMAAHGYIGISMEADQNRIQESLQGVFDFLTQKGSQYHIDAEKVGVYAASANVGQSVQYLMKTTAYKGIKAAVLYYGQSPQGPFRKDLPVLFVVAESDVQGDNYTTIWSEVLKNKAPWRLLMASGLPHAFDTFSGNDDARKVMRETISFWKNHLDPVPVFNDPHPTARQILATTYGHQPQKAADLLKTWTEQYPDEATGLSMYGRVLLDLKRYEESERVYQKAVALQPKNATALTHLALLSYLKNNPSEAESYVAKAIAVNGENRNLYASLAFPLLALGKFSESIPYYQKAIQLEPHGGDYYNMACAYALLNQKEKALDALEQALKLGYGAKEQYDSDPDLTSVRADERYKKLFPVAN